MKLGLICGMRAEARALGKLRPHPDLIVGVSAAMPERATELAEEMSGRGVDALVSWGIAGALSPELPSGALLVPEEVVDADGTRLALTGLRPFEANKSVTLAGSDQIIATPNAKAVLFASTDAVAVDMETHRIARTAVLHGIACVAIRAVSDPADRALPTGMEHALDAQGRPRILPVLAGLARHPSRLPALLSAKRDLDCALETLAALGAGLIADLLDR